MRTDFSTWDRKTLEQFAREVTDENNKLRETLRRVLHTLAALVKEALV
jgi:hypothetical protein